VTHLNRISRFRNFGIIAHVDAGKTTLTERILYYTGRIHRLGGVDEGTATTDFRPEERQKGITISAAAVRCPWRDHELSLVDTPGHADFAMEVTRSLRVLDGAVVVLDGVAGVEPQTEVVWRQADRHAIPRVCFVNKLDRAGADFERTLRAIAERLGARPVVINLPVGEERELEGVIDLVRMQAVIWTGDDGQHFEVRPIPDSLSEIARSHREALLEACAEADEAFLERWTSGELGEDDILAALRKGTLALRFVPVLAGSALHNRGVQPLLDALVDLLPAPEERPAIVDVETGEERVLSLEAPLAALCFKVVFDNFGAAAFVRIYAGTLERGDSVRVGDRRMRIGRLVRLFADRDEEVTSASAGEIVALIGTDLVTGDTISDPAHPILLEPPHPPPAVMRIALEPRTRIDRDRLPKALARLLVEDPSLRLVADPETGQTTLAGMGQLHLEMSVSRLESAHGVHVDTGAPRVAYRETIARTADVDVTHSKQTGGPGQFAHVILRVAPSSDRGLEFEDLVTGGALAREHVSGVRKGCEAAAQSGVLGGYPVVGVKVSLLGGSTHVQDSSEMAFAIAARKAFVDACRAAGPLLLEPCMRLVVHTPKEHVGDVIGDLSARRGKVVGMSTENVLHTVTAEVPLAELFGYADVLGSLTHGRGTHRMELARYSPVPEALVPRALERG
jgi:elongation factor G